MRLLGRLWRCKTGAKRPAVDSQALAQIVTKHVRGRADTLWEQIDGLRDEYRVPCDDAHAQPERSMPSVATEVTVGDKIARRSQAHMWSILFAVLLLAPQTAVPSPSNSASITQEELVRRTQELCDAVAIGNQKPWKEYFAEDSMYFDEKGRAMDKAALVADVTPLPTGYSGTIKLVRPKSRILGQTAILTYDLDETETVYGQNMTARYHGTDTWMLRNGQWQIVAGQMLRYYEDPAPGKVDAGKLSDYLGTYQLAPGITRTVSIEANELYSQRTGRKRESLTPEAADIFFRRGVEGRFVFRRDENGKVDALIDRRTMRT